MGVSAEDELAKAQREKKREEKKKKKSTKRHERWPDFGIRVRGRQAKGWFSNCSKTAKSDHSSRLVEENRTIGTRREGANGCSAGGLLGRLG